jgi:3-oxoacyl-[acyl-carrier-protein] synthase III
LQSDFNKTIIICIIQEWQDGLCVPETLILKKRLSKIIDTNDEWIQEQYRKRAHIIKEKSRLHLWVVKALLKPKAGRTEGVC